MGVNGTVNITELKKATGINDNRLSAHYPTDAGNNTKFSDFLIDAVGNRQEDFGPADYQSSLPVVGDPGTMYPGYTNDTQSFRIQVSQAHLSSPGSQGGSGAEHFYEQILKPSLNVSAGTLAGWSILKNDPTQDDFLNFEITLTAVDQDGIAGSFDFNGSLNSDATNWSGVSFAYTDVAQDPAAASFTWSQSTGSATVDYYDPDGEVDLDYAEFQMSSSVTSPSGTASFTSNSDGGGTASFTWDPDNRQISGNGDAGVTCYNTSGNVVPNGSLNGPSGDSGTVTVA